MRGSECSIPSISFVYNVPQETPAMAVDRPPDIERAGRARRRRLVVGHVARTDGAGGLRVAA